MALVIQAVSCATCGREWEFDPQDKELAPGQPCPAPQCEFDAIAARARRAYHAEVAEEAGGVIV
jgi:hypothetical protein